MACHVEMFPRVTPPILKVIGVYLLQFKANFDHLQKLLRGPILIEVCASKPVIL